MVRLFQRVQALAQRRFVTLTPSNTKNQVHTKQIPSIEKGHNMKFRLLLLKQLRQWMNQQMLRCGYDEYLKWLIGELKSGRHSKNVSQFLLEESGKGHLEEHHVVRFRRGEYNLITMFAEHAERVVNDLTLVNSLNLTSFPRLVETIEISPAEVVIITFTPHAKQQDVIDESRTNAPKESYLKVSKELMYLWEKGFVLDATFRYNVCVNDCKEIIIPSFHVFRAKDVSDRLQDIFIRYTMFDKDTWMLQIKLLLEKDNLHNECR